MPVTRLQAALLRWYSRNGRADLPWRKTRDPYRVLVSEFMLQQTQVQRVLPKYEEFIARFPDFQTLARTGTGDVLRMWRGLGYNSRALRLKRIAQAVIAEFGGTLPRETEHLLSLPGIGTYTAAAVRAFAFECDETAFDTNVRRVMQRFGFTSDQARRLLPRGKAHDWNSALMDLGTALCTPREPSCGVCPVRTHCAAGQSGEMPVTHQKRKKQESIPFVQTTRFARGRIIDALRELPAGKRVALLDLHRRLWPALRRSRRDFDAIVSQLAKEGLLDLRNRQVALPK